jgi:hypothetical protein
MANSQSICTSFLSDLLNATHNFGTSNPARSANTADTFKAALYQATSNSTSSTTLCATVTAYGTTVNTVPEVSGTNYTAGGTTVSTWNATNTNGTNATTGNIAYTTPTASFSWTTVTLTTPFDTVLIYNSSQSNKAVSVHTFGSQTITAGNFSLTMPTNASGTALIRLST